MQPEMLYIYTIYKEGSFSQAANKLFLSQSALSMAVQRVEEALGDTVFDRSKRPLRLTPVGEIYVQKYYEILQIEKELEEQIKDLSNLKGGSLKIGGTQYIFSYILAPILLQYTTRYPDIKLELVESGANRLDNMLLDGSIDICLKCEEVTKPLVSLDHAFSDTLFLAMPKSYVKQFNLPDTWLTRDIISSDTFCIDNHPALPPEYWSRIPLLMLTSGNNLHIRLLELYRQNNATPNIILEMQQLVTAYNLAISGLGATLTTEFIIKKNTGSDGICYRLDSPLVYRHFNFIMNKKGYISKAAQKFMDMTKEYYGGKSL